MQHDLPATEIICNELAFVAYCKRIENSSSTKLTKLSKYSCATKTRANSLYSNLGLK